MKTIVPFSVRILLGAIFAVAGVSKLIDAQSFLTTIQQLDIVPLWLIAPCGIIIIQSEIWLGFALLVGFRTRLTILLLTALILLFISVVLLALLRGDVGDCGCFGSFAQEQIGKGIIIRDLFLFLSCLWLLRVDKSTVSSKKMRGNEGDRIVVHE